MKVTPSPKPPMLFCEKTFGKFFFLWGLILILDYLFLDSNHGIFYGHLERYMPGWGWGTLFLFIGTAKWAAHRLRSRRCRVLCSAITFILLLIIASIAIFTGLWGATAPLALFAAYISFWCHRSMLRDTHVA